MYSKYTFAKYEFSKRLAMLLGCDIVLALIDSYLPHEWTPVRAVVALVEFAFMAVTMGVTMRRVVQDY